MKERYEAGDLGRVYYGLREEGELGLKMRVYGIWWDEVRGFYDGSYSDAELGSAVVPPHPSQLMGRPIHMYVDRVSQMPDRISAVANDPSYCGFYSDRFLEGLDEIGISVPHQEVEYGNPLDPLTAEERAMLGRRYYVLKFEESGMYFDGSELHSLHYYGDADLLLDSDGRECFTHPVMEMVHRKKLTGFDDARYCVELVSSYRCKMPPIPHDREEEKEWYKEQYRRSAAYCELPDLPLKDKRWPGKRLDYMLANGYRL